MENLEWYPVFYNSLETNVEVTKCGRIRKIPKDWYGNGNGSYKIKYGEITLNNIKLNKGYMQIGIQIKDLPQRMVGLHQLIASVFLGYKFQGNKNVIDHIDSNKLNNHIDNLRIITNRENSSKEKTIKSCLPVGVCFNKKAKKYVSRIFINGKNIHLGYFNTIEEASLVYDYNLKYNLK